MSRPENGVHSVNVRVDRVDLREKIAASFNIEELRTLCFDLGVEL